jgi:HK97 family phage prohead protease
MPWRVDQSTECPESRPWAVIKDDDGEVEGCHATEEAAKRQMAALYAQEAMNNVEHKTFNLIETKADDSGSFTALASVFGNVDHVGDRMMKGAFSKTLEKWRESGDPIPVILSHQWEDPNYVVGKADPRAVYEDDRGLVVQGQLDLGNPIAKQVHKLMKDRLLKGWSFGYTVPNGGQKQNNGANEVSEVDLVEVGPTLKGANPEARLEEVKSVIHQQAIEDAGEVIPADEVKGAEDDLLKAVWTAAYINTLPDSSFLYIESGGEKDDEGKTTPRSLRHFPVKDAEGNVDLPHLRNALARIPQSNLPDDVKNRIRRTAERMLENTRSAIEDAPDEEPSEAKSQAQDPLSHGHDRLAYQLATEGIDMAEPPQVKDEPSPELPSLAVLERQYHDLMLETLIGSENP